MATRRWLALGLVALAVGVLAPAVEAAGPATTVEKYGWKDAAGYADRFSAPYGPGEGTVTVTNHAVNVAAAPFTTAADFSVFDHLKYIRISDSSFAVPEEGSLEFAVDITASTPGTDPDRVIHGCYGPPGSWTVGQACDQPFSHTVLEGQQAGVVLNMINFETGQLFDWFVSGTEAFALIERLPSNVTGVGTVGLDRAYTQIIASTPIKPGQKHRVAIRYTRGEDLSRVEYFLDGRLFTAVDHVGVPLDVQDVPYTGYAPSLGPGEELSLDSFVIGHGLFSLLDAFPYQHPDRPDLSVSIPVSERLFGQGAIGTWKNFTVTTRTK